MSFLPDKFPVSSPVRPSAYMIEPETDVPFSSKKTWEVPKSLLEVHHFPAILSIGPVGNRAAALGDSVVMAEDLVRPLVLPLAVEDFGVTFLPTGFSSGNLPPEGT